MSGYPEWSAIRAAMNSRTASERRGNLRITIDANDAALLIHVAEIVAETLEIVERDRVNQ